eukprot:TRINITY_DN120893_c0_g1_i1.p1 TRINITY_DN120893_c0_g1~~TRINITY_DN120893_c0_g1_i1.p1  ORF type:complete len:574 (+),score=134.27 TRINITY_DN120893_c0_g1_i1:74-1795(+)
MEGEDGMGLEEEFAEEALPEELGLEGLEEAVDGMEGVTPEELGLEMEAEAEAELAAATAEELGIEEAVAEEEELQELLAAEAEADADVAVGEEEVAPYEQEDDEAPADESLKEAVEGSLRLKRMLSQGDGSDAKRAKMELPPEKRALVDKLAKRWALTWDVSVVHVLENIEIEELETLDKTQYRPRGDTKKTQAEFLAQHICSLREANLPSGSAIDVLQAFVFRWKHTFPTMQGLAPKLRALSHKDLRYVIDRYDGSQDLDELMAKAEGEEPGDDEVTENALPAGVGHKTISRFNRLELIDPMADSAVFGDANLSFSINLARHRDGLGHVGRVIATTFEDGPTLRQRYTEIDETIKTLEDDFDAEVYHEVDCTRIALDERLNAMKGTLGAVYYNFPHSGAIRGFFDSHPFVNWRHENLMRLFFRALRTFVKPGGVVKVASNKGAVGVRYSYIIGSALENEFLHTETMPFGEWALHRYGRSYGDKRDEHKRPDAKKNESYNAQAGHNDMVYCFRYAPSGESLPAQKVMPPPTLEYLKKCRDGAFGKVHTQAQRDALAADMHARFVQEISGIHVG